MSREIKIEITGPAAVGKTTVARVIMAALHSYGLNANYESYEDINLSKLPEINDLVANLQGTDIAIFESLSSRDILETSNKFVTKKFIDIVCPEHTPFPFNSGEKQCNDRYLNNAFIKSDGRAKCLRCYLLDNLGVKLANLPINLDVVQKPKMEKKTFEIELPVGAEIPLEIRKYLKHD